MVDDPISRNVKSQWGAVKSLLKYTQGRMTREQHQSSVNEIQKHVKSAGDSIPPHLEEKLGIIMRQMYSTTNVDDEMTLVPEDSFIGSKKTG